MKTFPKCDLCLRTNLKALWGNCQQLAAGHGIGKSMDIALNGWLLRQRLTIIVERKAEVMKLLCVGNIR